MVKMNYSFIDGGNLSLVFEKLACDMQERKIEKAQQSPS